MPLLIGVFLVITTIVLKLQDVNRTQARYDLNILLEELRRPDLWSDQDLEDNNERLFLASTASQALYRARIYAPDRINAIDSTLQVMAEWVARRDNFPQWRNQRRWDREVYFLAHAAIVFGHYQLTTRDETFAPRLNEVCQHLGQRMKRGRYKHLISRNGEDFFRPADNAAALYALSLYDAYHGTNLAEPAFSDWADYLRDELYFAESRLPCAAFSTTDRCRLEPSATATGLYIAYRAAASPQEQPSDIPWQEWLHYFKKTTLSPFSLSIRSNMRDGEPTRFCNQGVAPLTCERYENVIGLWAAAEYEGSYTYFRLFATGVLRRWLQDAPLYHNLRPPRRVVPLTHLALRTIGESHP